METKELLKKVRKIEIKTRRLSDHLFSGAYHTSFKGKGMTFSEVRQYQFGDDVRAIDWNVTARYNEPYVKVFEEERELTLMLLVDVSQSQNFATQQQLKSEMATEIAATLAFSATNNNDKIGLLLFTDEVELYIPPKKGKTHVLRIIRELVEFQPKNTGTNLQKALHYLSRVQKRKANVFLISDFWDNAYQSSLQIAARKHDITGIKLFDKTEQKLGTIGFMTVKNPETGAIFQLDTQAAALQSAISDAFVTSDHYFAESFTKAGCGTIKLAVNENFVPQLIRYFASK